jgi:hypothetical protein
MVPKSGVVAYRDVCVEFGRPGLAGRCVHQLKQPAAADPVGRR